MDVAMRAAAASGQHATMQDLFDGGLTADDARKGSILHIAARNGHDRVVRTLFANGLTADDARKECILHVAARNGHDKVVRVLFDNGLTAHDARKECILHVAARTGHDKVVRVLFDNGLTADDARKDCILHVAARNGYDKIVQILFDNGLTADDARKEGILDVATRNGYDKIVQILFNLGRTADSEDGDESDADAMGAAAKANKPEDMRLLFRKMTIQDTYAGDSTNYPMLICAQLGRVECMQVLINNGMSLRDVRQNGLLPIAVNNGHHIIVGMLVKLGLTVDDVRVRNYNVLASAILGGHWKIVQTLCELGLTARDLRYNDNQFLKMAADKGYHRIVHILSCGDLTADDARAEHNFALKAAARNGHDLVVRVLHEVMGLTADDARVDGNAPLLKAVAYGHKDVVVALFDMGLDGRDVRSNNCEALVHAAAIGDLRIVETLCQRGHLICEDVRANDVVHHAAANGHHEVLRFLWTQMGLHIDGVRVNNYRALRHAFNNGCVEVIRVLLDMEKSGGDNSEAGSLAETVSLLLDQALQFQHLRANSDMGIRRAARAAQSAFARALKDADLVPET